MIFRYTHIKDRDLDDSIGEALGVKTLPEPAPIARIETRAGIADHLTDRGIGRGDHARAALHGFEDRQSESFIQGRINESQGLRVEVVVFEVGLAGGQDRNAPLSPARERRNELDELLAKEPYREVTPMIQTWFDEGLQRGRQEGMEEGVRVGQRRSLRMLLAESKWKNAPSLMRQRPSFCVPIQSVPSRAAHNALICLPAISG